MKDKLPQDSPSFSTEIIRQVIAAKIIAIICNQGAGKTTLALKLAEIIGLDYVEAFIFWKDNKMPKQKFRNSRIESAYETTGLSMVTSDCSNWPIQSSC